MTDQIDLMPYQAEFVESVLQSSGPARFVLISSPGTGKTVAISVALSRFAAAGHPRFLVVSPAPLLRFWVELLQQVGVPATLVDAQAYRSLQTSSPEAARPWAHVGAAVVSIDFLKREERLVDLLESSWDVVVLDEAHLYSAGSLRGKIGRALWHSNVRIGIAASGVLSATNWFLNECAPIIRVWRREHLKDANGQPLFASPRLTWSEYSPTPAEKRFKERVLASLRRLGPDSSPLRFVRNVLTRRLLSSLFAIEQSLRRLVARSVENKVINFEEPDQWIGEEESDSTQGVDQLFSAGDLAEELALFEEIETDSKLEYSLQLVGALMYEGKSVIVFTDYADTAEYVGRRYEDAGLPTFVITGEKHLEERYRFLGEAQKQQSILVLTSAVTEGLRLTHTNCAVHYDVPFDPAQLYRRLYGLDRAGGRFAFVDHQFLVERGSEESDLLRSMYAKIFEIQASLGNVDDFLSDTLLRDLGG